MPLKTEQTPLQISQKNYISLNRSSYSFTEKILRQVTRSITNGCITFELRDGRKIECNSGNNGPQALIQINSYRALKRLVSSGYLGLAEGYINQEWTTPSLPNVFDFGAVNLEVLDKNLTDNIFVRFVNNLIKFINRNNKKGSLKNISKHYDLGNDFFSEWLDPTMTYSSALYSHQAEELSSAQNRKYQRIIDVLKINKNDKVLEIGCGWGGFAEYAARETGAMIAGITISQEQHTFATERIRKAGLNQQVEIQLTDYREVTGLYDKIVSIEMLEAVGEAYWPQYFKTVADRLTERGSAMIQVITIPDDYFDFYRTSTDFIQRYIFPGGMLLCQSKIKEHGKAVGLTLTDAHMFGDSYAKTINEWQRVFQTQWHKIENLGFDEKFKRIWEYYLDYTSAGFKSGSINVGQFHLLKT
jgi:cyclopropane-fatty-acyl-phospholipid synthase